MAFIRGNCFVNGTQYHTEGTAAPAALANELVAWRHAVRISGKAYPTWLASTQTEAVGSSLHLLSSLPT